MAKERLDKILASTGRWSRRDAHALVRAGAVCVDGIPVRSAEEKVDAGTCTITVGGERVEYREFTWVMLNKPAGVLSATEDGRGATVLDLLPQDLRRQGLFPVGRLDKDTEGLLLLTNDGALAHDLLSPKKHVDKEYRARVRGRLEEADVRAFADGIVLSDGTACQSAALSILSAGEESEARVTLREGKFHQVKRMFAARGTQVLALERTRMGNLTLDRALGRGEYRLLTEEEVEILRNSSPRTHK